MRRTFFAFILIIVVAASVIALVWLFSARIGKDNSTEIYQENGGIVYYQPADRSYSLVVFEKPKLGIKFVSQNVTSLAEQAEQENWQAAINGGYFFNSSIDARPVGLLQIKGQVISQLVTDSQKQATHVMIWDQTQNQLNFASTQDVNVGDYSGAQFSMMQAGPLFVRSNVLQSKAIKDSLNGSGSYLRTVIGYTKDDRVFFSISRYAVTLQEFAQLLKASPVLAPTSITALNLDGGSSTALYTRAVEALNFGETKRLPIMLGVSK
jgi:uncharacterized protein YigE (DUF2233 family)